MDFLIKLSKNRVCQIVVGLLVIIIILLIIFWPRKTAINENNYGFTCPADGEYVDCMPQVYGNAKEEKAAELQAEYCQFVEENCPDANIAY